MVIKTDSITSMANPSGQDQAIYAADQSEAIKSQMKKEVENVALTGSFNNKENFISLNKNLLEGSDALTATATTGKVASDIATSDKGKVNETEKDKKTNDVSASTQDDEQSKANPLLEGLETNSSKDKSKTIKNEMKSQGEKKLEANKKGAAKKAQPEKRTFGSKRK